jgi:hypothetical protein
MTIERTWSDRPYPRCGMIQVQGLKTDPSVYGAGIRHQASSSRSELSRSCSRPVYPPRKAADQPAIPMRGPAKPTRRWSGSSHGPPPVVPNPRLPATRTRTCTCLLYRTDIYCCDILYHPPAGLSNRLSRLGQDRFSPIWAAVRELVLLLVDQLSQYNTGSLCR